MTLKIAFGTAISSLFLASAVSAASLSIVGGVSVELSGDHNPAYGAESAPIGTGDFVRAFGTDYDPFDGSNGLHLNEAATVKITYLGKEAAAENVAMNLSGGEVSNMDATGTTISSLDLPSWVDLAFTTYGVQNPTLVRGTITNNIGQTGDPALNLAFYQVNSKTVYAFFGDGRRDSDFDDMVARISVVPLPAGGLLLLTALGGFAAVRRKKKAA